jgi:hypothetical protein
MATATRLKAKGKKIGRNKRKPSQQRYNNERRWIDNKERRIAKDKKRKK